MSYKEKRASLIAQANALLSKPNYSKEDKSKFDSLMSLADAFIGVEEPAGTEEGRSVDSGLKAFRQYLRDGDRSMFFLTSSVTPTSDEQARTVQQAIIRQTKVSEVEHAFVIETLNDFRTQYEVMVADYNKRATAANNAGLGFDATQFVASRDALVLAARDKLHAGLGTVSLINFQARVQSFKTHMTVSP